MSDKPEFWHRVCTSLFVKSPRWFSAVRTLPDKLDLGVCLQNTVGAEGAFNSGIRAQGWVGGTVITETNPNFFTPEDLPVQIQKWAYSQYMFQFMIFEGLYNYLDLNGQAAPDKWNGEALKKFIELSQTMAFYSAMLILWEEGRLPENEAEIEAPIREELRKICDVLTSKTTDYGQAFLRHGVVGLLYRVWDKIARYATLSAEDRSAKYESRKDTAMDMLGYSVLIWSILEETHYVRSEVKAIALGEPL